MPEAPDLIRLREEYKNREHRFSGQDLYSPFNPSHLFLLQSRQRESLKVLRSNGFTYLEDCKILEIGCGQGGILIELLTYGGKQARLFGMDLLFNRLHSAHDRLQLDQLLCADAQYLPYPDGSFNLILQYTVFSSILDEQIKKNIAREMLRVLHKNDGMILWYDFFINPTNPQTRGIRPHEIRTLFPGCRFDFHRITLAPPIARRLVPFSWGLAYLLEKLHIFNTHYMVAICPQKHKEINLERELD